MIGDVMNKAMMIQPGVTTLRLPDGTTIALGDFYDHTLYGTADFHAGGVYHPVQVFSIGRSQTVPGSARCASYADTNLQRPGNAGLPLDHQMIVQGWRAVAIGPTPVITCDAAQAWFASTVAILEYRSRSYAVLPLLELLRAVPVVPPDPDTPVPRDPHDRYTPLPPLAGQRFSLPLNIRNHLNFDVRIEPQSGLAGAALSITLAHVGAYFSIRVFLDGLYKAPV